MNLQPPSFFEVAPPQSVERTESGKWREEVTRLNRENRILREQLEAYTSPISQPLPNLTVTSVSPPPRLPSLTSDLLHVEECLQSRVRMLEGEKREASLQMLELEKTLAQQKRQFHTLMETTRKEHDEAMYKVESERQRVSLEYQAYQEDQGRKMKLLNAELSMQQEQHMTEMEKLLAKSSKLEHKLALLDTEEKEVVGSLRLELASVNRQLTQSREEADNLKMTSSKEISVLTEQVTAHCQKVKQLEAYLGGEIPDLLEGQEGRTWKEERQFLYFEIQKTDREVQKLRSENYLLNVRLDSMSEILSLQEADITKRGSDQMDRVKGLLTRWREKVFALLVQQKIQEIEDIRRKEDCQKEGACLTERVREVEREQTILSHALADKDAQLQLQETRNEALKLELDETRFKLSSVERDLHLRCRANGGNVRCMAQLFTGFKATFNQALTQMANYEHRIAFATKRVRSLKATLGCRLALLASRHACKSDAECQAPEGTPEEREEEKEEEEEEDLGFSTLSRERLLMEVETLCRERDGLIGQLRESTEAFQEQLQSVKDKYLSEEEGLRARLDGVETECASLQQSQADLELKLRCAEEDKENLSKMAQELNRELEKVQATMESRIESEVLIQKQQSQAELSGMEELLAVARREHSKAILQLQQLSRKMASETDRAAELAEMGRAKMEEELNSSKKQLQSIQVERNLLLTTLRQEDKDPLLQPKHLSIPRQRARKERGQGSPTKPEQQPDHDSHPLDNQQEDIRDVLKDLHTLSASLLNLESETREQCEQP